jgi:hypothetical protein
VSAEATDFEETIAFRNTISAIPQFAGRVGVGSAPLGPDKSVLSADDPYAVITGSTADETPDRFAASAWKRRPSWIVHVVAATELSAIIGMGWIDDVLRPGPFRRGITIPVPGRSTRPVRRLERPGNALDDIADPAVWYAIAVYGFESDPASSAHP